MKPGRELDALIAEKVMGWTNISFTGEETASRLIGFGVPNNGGFRRAFPIYSTEISAAWEVAEKFTAVFRLEKHFRPTEWWCEVYDGENGGTSTGETPSHAICLAALKAMGVEV